ncbi:hypothetical protein AJ80_05295 [Polytolypa hystricis UAMH7299]|uniref:Protein SQS1 n=1 Tax=Polytolypa hystricis (strain UAMH7299) TaxID=1447883 RepID=A0A2B7Y4B9_POLH7|nr:hypothetical protein AJ80_05295 [Polytolypa hystricis UAMH7299]
MGSHKPKKRGRRREAAVATKLAGDSTQGGFKHSDHGLTMSQEARNTERHSLWRPGLQLRHSGIQFVTAGDLKFDDPKDLVDKAKTSSIASPPPVLQRSDETNPQSINELLDEQIEACGKGQQSSVDPAEEKPEEGDIYFIDVVGDKSSSKPAITDSAGEARIMPESDSSEDEVVFAGRGLARNQSVQYDFRERGTSDDGDDDAEFVAVTGKPTILDDPMPLVNRSPDIPVQEEIPAAQPTMSKRKKRRARRAQQEFDNDDELLADYIAHMDHEDSEEEDSWTSRHQVGHSQTLPGHQNKKPDYMGTWDAADLDDLYDLSTSDELPEDLGHIFSVRERRRKIQYLIVGKDQSPDEARWVEKGRLTMLGAEELISLFEQEAHRSNTHSNTSSNDDGNDGPTELLWEDDDDDDVMEDMTDEQIARALQKQDLFGIGTEEIMLFNGSTRLKNTDREEERPGFSKRNSRKQKSSRRQRTQFPSASAFADALDEDPYGAFDIMDFDRPSIRNKPKGRHQMPDFGLSDSDQEWDLMESWENDRKKKKAQRKQREELRAQGSLGIKSNKVSLKATYSEGLSMEDIKREIRAFLLSPSESLSLPPINKADRKLVHELASVLCLRSVSRGHGGSRFPILTKTMRSQRFNGKTISEVDKIFSSQRFLRRTDTQRKGRGGPSLGAKAGASIKAASHRDGDVVGASAPEIGAENKGRVMLEKMGWSTGTALGATNNKGILQPVVHIVKNSKAGLG